MRNCLFARDAVRVCARAAIAGLLSLGSVLAQAQVTAPPDAAGRILESVTREPVRIPAPERDVRPKVPEAKPALPVSPTLKVQVTKFSFSGNTLFTDEELTEVVQEFVGKELDFEGLNDAANKVRAYHRSRGYFLAQAYLPEQAIREGSVEITVIEGRLGQVELLRRPGTRLSERLLVGILGQHLKPGDVITEIGLERPLLIINDLPTASVTSEIRPSATPGAADLRVNVDGGVGLFNGFVDFDNHNSRFTGEYRLGASLNLNNPLTIGDQLTVRGFETNEDMTFARVAYLAPVGHWGTRAGVSAIQFDYKLAEQFAGLQAHGKGYVRSAFVFHPLYRTRNSNLIGQLAYEDKRLYDRIDTLGTAEDRFIESWKLGAVGDFRDAFLSGGLNAFSITWTAGDLRIEPPNVLAADQDPVTGPKTAGKFEKLMLDFRRLNRITDNASALLGITAQRATKNLASSERMSLGGPTGVRAYPVGEAAGDSALLVQGELRYIFPGVKFLEGDVLLSAHYDWGEAKVRHDPLVTDDKNKRSISGYGFGLSLGREGYFVVRGTASWQHDHEVPLADSAKRDPRVFVQAVTWF